MLSRSSLTLLTLLAASSGACVINSTPDGAGGSGGGTTSANGTGGGGGDGTTTSSAGGGTTNGSGGGGGGTCTDPAGTGELVAECGNTNVASITTCPSTGEAPLANPTCTRSFEIYTAGAWEDLLACIGTIPATIAEACDDPAAVNNVANCVAEMYANACPNPAMDTNCDNTLAACDGMGQTGFDTAACKSDLAPFSADGYAEYVACFNDTTITDTCDTIHDTCMDIILTLP